MNTLWRTCVLTWLVLVAGIIQGAGIRSFDDPQLEARYITLIAELRCLVCQNQSLADSNAELAKDLRERVFNLLHAGKTDQEITAHIVERFSEFVLYRPPLNRATFLLWFGPLLMAIIGLAVIFRLAKRRPHLRSTGLNKTEEAELEKLLIEPDHLHHPPEP